VLNRSLHVCRLLLVDQLPEGVRLLSVYVTSEEFDILTGRAPVVSKTALPAKVKRLRQRQFRRFFSESELPTSSSTATRSSSGVEVHTLPGEWPMPVKYEKQCVAAESGIGGTSSNREAADSSDNSQSASNVTFNGRQQMELYVVGNSQSVFLFFTDPGCIRDSDLRLNLVSKLLVNSE
jgi:hypothetical protein